MEPGIVKKGDRVVAKRPLSAGRIPAGSTGTVTHVYVPSDCVTVSWDGFAGRLESSSPTAPTDGITDGSGWSVNSCHIELMDDRLEKFDVESLFQSV